jgi:hypothetical protein
MKKGNAMKTVKTVLVGAILGAFASVSAVHAEQLPGRNFKDSGDACNSVGCGDMTWAEIAGSTRAPSGGPFLAMSPFLRYEIARDPALFPYNDGAVCNDLDGNNPNPVQPAATFANPRVVFQGTLAVEPSSTNITFDVGIDGRIQSEIGASQSGSNGTVWYGIWLVPAGQGFASAPNYFGYVIGSGEGTNSVFGRSQTSSGVEVNVPVSAPRGIPQTVEYDYRVITWAVASPSPLYVILRAAACQPRLLVSSGFDFGPSPLNVVGAPVGK